MSVDTKSPPKGWRWASPRQTEDEDEPHCHRNLGMGEAPLSEAHRIARKEAQPYVAEALELIAGWLDSDECRAEWFAVRHQHGSFESWRLKQLREMAAGRRLLP